ncbi:MAG: hypothetical protein ACKVPJ_12090 [Chitinophagales bacterium]
MQKIFFPLLTLFFFSCSEKTSGGASLNGQPLLKEGWVQYENDSFTIQYPQGWEATEDNQHGTLLIIKSKAETESDEFLENINVIMQDVSAFDLDLKEYTKISEEQVSSFITNSKILENKTLKNQTGEYQKLVYTGDQGKFNLQFEQYYWIKDEKAWVVTFTSEQKSYMSFKDAGDGILNSFYLK